MRRPAPSLAISPALFKNFAIATVIITAGVAMFADGENRQAVEEVVQQREAKNAAKRAEVANNGGVSMSIAVRDPHQIQGSWGKVENPVASPASASVSSVAQAPYPAGNIKRKKRRYAPVDSPEAIREMIASGGISRPLKPGEAPLPPTPDEMDAGIRASLARSGTPST